MAFSDNISPCFITNAEWAISQGNRLLIIPKEKKQILGQKYSLVAISKVIFGLRLPYLPDLMHSPNILSSNEKDGLGEIWQRQINLLTGLRKWRASSFSLRYFWNPKSKRVDIVILGSGMCLTGEENIFSAKISEDIAQLFAGYEYSVQPITRMDELSFYLDPFRKSYICEVRQREKLLPMARGKAYVVYPFGVSLHSTWINLFSTIFSQPSACLINLHLEITATTETESQFFAQASQLAASLSHENFNGLAGQYKFVDPVAQTVSEIYNDYVQRFHDPFLVVAQTVSPDPLVARNIAQGILAEVADASINLKKLPDEKSPTGAELILPSSEQDKQAARQTLTQLELAIWGRSEARSDQERLPYMVDARTASAIFRFPIALRGGIPGIEIRQEMEQKNMLRILFLAAEPTDTSRLRVGEELREIREKLQLAKLREKFELHDRTSVRPTDISQALLDLQPQIIHFSGHGMVNGALCFEDGLGKTKPIQPDALSALFEQFANQIDCVILNACFSEIQAKAIAKHISYVIGMNQAIGDKAAIAFTIGFYQALGAGRSVEQAYKLGCVQIGLHGIPEHLTPVLIQKEQI